METIQNIPLRKLPIGIQSFEKLRQEAFLYVDKTALLYQLTSTGTAYFLSRPRRFGKSLLLSTLRAYFEGKKELFKDLAVMQLETEWKQYPVLYLSLNSEKYESRERLEGMLNDQLSLWEEKYGTSPTETSFSLRFKGIIRRAYEKTGQKVVVLVDEYDKPLLEILNNKEMQDDFRKTLASFYTVLKDSDEYLRFVLLTGVTKFAQVGVFSNLNQLADISLTSQYANLCGLTLPEIKTTFAPEIEALGKVRKLTYEQTIAKLTKLYDGYRFSEEATEGVYNPFSLLNVLNYQSFRNYWFSTGTPTFLAEMLKKTDYDLRQLDGIEVLASELIDYRVDYTNPVPVIYQSGYLTIKGYDEELQLYTLGYPNDEVKYGFLNFVTPFYTPMQETQAPFYIGRFMQELRDGKTEEFLSRLCAFFADFTYELSDKTERHYQVVFYLVFKLLGQYVDAEVRSCKGRADAVVKTKEYIYIFEFKLNGTAEEAITQIDDKGYMIPFTVDNRTLIKVGVSFSAETRNIDKWIII